MLLNEIRWALLRLTKNPGDVFANHPQTQQLHSTKEENHCHERRIACTSWHTEQWSDEQIEDVDGGQEGDEEAQHSRDAQWRGCKARDAINSEVDECARTLLDGASSPWVAVIKNLLLFIPHPAKDRFGIALRFAQLGDGSDAAFAK